MSRITDALLNNKIKIISGLIGVTLVAYATYKSFSSTGNITELKLSKLTKEQRIVVYQLKELKVSDKDIDRRIQLLLSVKGQIESAKRAIEKGEYTKASNIIINIKEYIVALEETKTFGTNELRNQVKELRKLLGQRIKGELNKEEVSEDEE